MTEKMEPAGQARRHRFPGLFWLVILFEFFERGSYYGMMSVLSVYFTDVLFFPKESVGVIKSVIQPILYFLPIVSGALADRFGYRKALTVAFALLGTGYFLTSQFTTYTYVFLALVVMALGAGTFKPIISGTIARVTDKETSTLGFGIYYWSINLGAFLFPLVLVPWLKHSYGWHWVIIAAAIGTGTMLIPMALFFREPARPTEGSAARASLVQTLANAFEIVFSRRRVSPSACWRSARGRCMSTPRRPKPRSTSKRCPTPAGARRCWWRCGATSPIRRISGCRRRAPIPPKPAGRCTASKCSSRQTSRASWMRW